jgi:hypothetical protein
MAGPALQYYNRAATVWSLCEKSLRIGTARGDELRIKAAVDT